MTSESLLSRLAQALDAEDLPYMIIGGQAVLLYGEPRVTRDIDVTLAATPEDLHPIRRVIQKLGLRPLIAEIEAFVRKTWVLPTLDEETGLRVDFIFSWTSYERLAIARARTIPISGYLVRFATPEDVIIHKALAGRPRDWEDIRAILRKQSIDSEEIRRWLSAFSEALGRDLLSPFERICAEESEGRPSDPPFPLSSSPSI
ncbi:nucleotidyl transferase AbiEii/AbiGii toxin family protein [Thermoflexus sp.]|uniref:nucleotidyl transferase AbiEii/AbiGii toxin family protein n=1 Tax=Thermoflexus sp. TaxID=1969742 RepID=UPI0035E43AAD